MTEKNLNALAVTPGPKTVPSTRQENSITTKPLFEEIPTPAAIGAEADPCNVNFELSDSGPFGAY